MQKFDIIDCNQFTVKKHTVSLATRDEQNRKNSTTAFSCFWSIYDKFSNGRLFICKKLLPGST